MKKFLSLALCVVMMLSVALSLISCEEKTETETYEYASMKVESVTVGGQDYTEQLAGELRKEFDEEDMKDAKIEITGKNISFKDDDDKDEKDRTYEFTLNGDEIVCENLKEDFAKEFVEGSNFKNVDFAFFKKGNSAIEMKMDITVEESGMEIKVIMTYVFEKK